MKTFFKDWKNIGLISCGLIIIVLVGLLIFRPGDSGAVLVQVIGQKKYDITKEQVYQEMKKSMGDKLVTRLVDQYVLEDYAASKGVTLTKAEMDTFISLQSVMMEAQQGQTLDAVLKAQNMTMDDVYNQLTTTLLQVKLVVPENDIKVGLAKIVKENKPPFSLPTHYRYRELIFPSPEKAKEAAAAINKDPKSFDTFAAEALNARNATDTKLLIPGVEQSVMGRPTKDPALQKALAGMKLNQASAPIPMPISGLDNFRRVIQLTEILPAQKPTMENCGLLIGQQLLMSDQQKYGAKVKEIEGEALNKIDLKFLDFKAVSDAFTKKKQELSPALGATPTAPGAPTPGLGAPRLPSAPPPPPTKPQGGR